MILWVEAKNYVVRLSDSVYKAPNCTFKPQKDHRNLPKYRRILQKNHRIRYLKMTNRQTKLQESCTPNHSITPYPKEMPLQMLAPAVEMYPHSHKQETLPKCSFLRRPSTKCTERYVSSTKCTWRYAAPRARSATYLQVHFVLDTYLSVHFVPGC
jgi:hypothetical protein